MGRATSEAILGEAAEGELVPLAVGWWVLSPGFYQVTLAGPPASLDHLSNASSGQGLCQLPLHTLFVVLPHLPVPPGQDGSGGWMWSHCTGTPSQGSTQAQASF